MRHLKCLSLELDLVRKERMMRDLGNRVFFHRLVLFRYRRHIFHWMIRRNDMINGPPIADSSVQRVVVWCKPVGGHLHGEKPASLALAL